MEDLQSRLARIGYRRERNEPECWQVARSGAPSGASPTSAREPSRSRALLAWLDRLRDRHRPAPYQICLAMHIAAAERRLGRHLR